MKVLFRVDASPKIGMGHLQRCLSLACAFKQHESGSLFLTNSHPVVSDRLKRLGLESWNLDGMTSWSSEDCAQTAALAATKGCRTLIVDSDEEGSDYLLRLRQAGYLVCAIEDMALQPFPCQIVINGDAHAHQLAYKTSCADTQLLLGPQYSILRPEFWDMRPRRRREQVQHLLVTLGGADPYQLMSPILQTLDAIPGEWAISAIIGPFFAHPQKLTAVVQKMRHPITPVYAPETVCDLMGDVDLAVSAAGQTLYELACVGCPTVAFSVADNQEGQLGAFAQAGFVHSVGGVDQADLIEKIGCAVSRLLQDPTERMRMSQIGQRMVDGRGALRVAQTLLATAKRVFRESSESDTCFSTSRLRDLSGQGFRP